MWENMLLIGKHPDRRGTNDHDEIQARVAEALAAATRGTRADMKAAYRAIEPLVVSDVVAVEDATTGVDLDILLASTTLPVPPNPVDLVAAVHDKDLHAFMAATDKHTIERMLSTLLLLAASLTDARATTEDAA